MIAFEVTVNDEQPVVAGIDGHGVVNAIVCWLSRTDPNDPTHETPRIDVEVAGLIPDFAHVKWLERDLRVGNRNHLEVVDADRADKPEKRRKIDKDRDERREREYYERMKKKYG